MDQVRVRRAAIASISRRIASRRAASADRSMPSAQIRTVSFEIGCGGRINLGEAGAADAAKGIAGARPIAARKDLRFIVNS